MWRWEVGKDISWKDPLFIYALAMVTAFAVAILINAFLNFTGGQLLFVNTLVQDLVIVATIVCLLRRRYHLPWSRIGIRPISPETVVTAVMWGVGVLIIMTGLVSMLNMLLPRGLPPQNVEAIFSVGTPAAAFVLSMFLMGVVAPITEELLFRGYLYEALKLHLTQRSAMMATSVVFAAVHMDIYRFLPLAFGGYALNVLAERKKSITASMIMHATWNGLMVIMAFVSMVAK